MNNCKLFGVRVRFTDKNKKERVLINYYLAFENGKVVRINPNNWKDEEGNWHTESETKLSILCVMVDTLDDVKF